MLKQIELIDGQQVDIDVRVNALTLLTLQNEGVINADFLKAILDGKRKEMNVDPISIISAVYAAYRQKHQKDALPYKEFLTRYQLTIETDLDIYFAVISKEYRKKFQVGFQQAGVAKGKKSKPRQSK
ncbi:MAG: hypothetical protein ABS951_06635 [Solibacillus sp.]